MKFLSPFFEHVKQHVRAYSIGSAGVLVFWILAFFAYRFFFAVPEVLAGNWSFEYRKIPYNVPSIDVTFSKNLKNDTINAATVHIEPYVEGVVKLKDGNTISYELTKQLKIGDRYTISLSADIESEYGRKIGRDIRFEVEAIAGAKAIRVIPEGKLENPMKNIVVLFNIPVIPLTSNAEKDKLPCPLTITPNVPGKCKWTSGTILEYIPDAPLNLATKYHFEVASATGLLYPLEGKRSGDFETEALTFDEAPNALFDPHAWLPVRLNAPVKASELWAVVTLSHDGKIFPATWKSASGSDDTSRTFIAIPASSEGFLYGTTYSLAFSGELHPALGNMSLTGSFTKYLTSESFLSNWYVGYDVRSETGALVDSPIVTYSTTDEKHFLPTQNAFFVLNFAKEVDLASLPIKLRSDKEVVLKASYIQNEVIEQKSGITTTRKIDDKTQVRLDITEPLSYGKEYVLEIVKSADSALKEDIRVVLSTPPAPQIVEFTPVTNTEACVYMKTKLDAMNAGYFELEPKAAIRSVESQELFSDEEKAAGTFGNGLCKRKDGLVGYLLNMRPNPGVNYLLRTTKLWKDFVGNSLSVPFESKKFTALPTKETDKFLYSLRKDINTVPETASVIGAYRTTNLDNFTLEACEIDEKTLLSLVSHLWEPNLDLPCWGNRVRKTIATQNHHWALTNTRVDFEKEVFGKKITSPAIVVRASQNGSFNQSNGGYRQDGREIFEVYVRQWLALALEQGKDMSYIYATNLSGTEIPGDMNFTVYSYDYNSRSIETKPVKFLFNREKWHYEGKVPAGFYAIIGRDNQGRFGIIRASDQSSNYDFGYISGQSSAMEREYAFVYTDRPIYRPGDTIDLKGVLRHFAPAGYLPSQAKKVQIRILKEDYTLFRELSVPVDKNSNFHTTFELAKDSEMGRFTFEISLPDMENSMVYNDGYFHVEAYKKPTFKTIVTSSVTDHLIGDTTKLGVSGEYYFWGKLVNTNYVYSVVASNYFFDAKSYADYQFGEDYQVSDCLYYGYCVYNDETVETWTGRVDENGNGAFDFAYPKDLVNTSHNNEKNGERTYTFSVDLTDPTTGKTVSNSATEILHSTDGYVGIKTAYAYAKWTPITVDGIVLDFKAIPKGSKDVRLELIKRDWQMAKKQWVDGNFYNDYVLKEEKESEISTSSNKEGMFHAAINPKQEGEYLVRAIYTGSNGKEYISSRSVYVESDNAFLWNSSNNSVTEMVAEKSVVKPGDTAVFTLKSPVRKGKYFITVEKDDGILESFVKDLEGYSARIEIPISEKYIPNVYVKAYIIGQDDGMDLPVYKRALSGVKVLADSKKLSVEIVPEKANTLPGSKMGVLIRVKDASGNPVSWANGSLSVVDESVLALVGNPLKNPFAFFYEMRRYLGVETFVSLASLIDRLDIPNTNNGEKGGAWDMMKWGDAKKRRGDFRDTAFWAPDFTTDANGEARITIEKLPDNLTNWVFEAVVSTLQNTAIGVARANVLTEKPLMIHENLPRFLVFGDKITLSPSITNRTGKDGYIRINGSVEYGKLKNTSERIFVKNGETVPVPFVLDMDVNSDISNPASKVLFSAKMESGEDQDEVQNILPIVSSSLREVTATAGSTVDNSFTEKLDTNDIQNGQLEFRVSASPFASIEEGLAYLGSYPYGCLEQRTSALLPYLSIKSLYDSIGEPYDFTKHMLSKYVDKEQGYIQVSLDETLKEYISILSWFQKWNGGFVYWNDQKDRDITADFKLSAETAEMIALLQKQGYTVDNSMVKSLKEYLATRLAAWVRENCSGDSKYCAYTSSEKLVAVIGLTLLDGDGIRWTKEFSRIDRTKLEPSSDRLLSLRALSILERASEGEQKTKLHAELKSELDYVLKNLLVVNARWAFIGGFGENSRIINTALFLESLSSMRKEFSDTEAILENMERYLGSLRKWDGSFGSTRETSAVIRSIAKVLEDSGDLKNAAFIGGIHMNENLLSERAFSGTSRFEVLTQTQSTNGIPENSEIVFTKNGPGKLYYDVSLAHDIPADKIISRDEGFYVETHFYDLAEYKRIESLKQAEWQKYLNGEIELADMKYGKEIREYLSEKKTFKVGELAYVETRIVTSEPRKQMAFEAMIPSGTELVNTKLSTETQSAVSNGAIFDHEELRDDRYFGTVSTLEAGDYSVGYTLRMTHGGEFAFAPARAYEFNNGEVSGNAEGRIITVQ